LGKIAHTSGRLDLPTVGRGAFAAPSAHIDRSALDPDGFAFHVRAWRRSG
jgi:hypothetical protein